jgi:hypothetical protein
MLALHRYFLSFRAKQNNAIAFTPSGEKQVYELRIIKPIPKCFLAI